MPSNAQARRQGARNQFGVEDLVMNRQYGRLQHHNKPVKETLTNVAATQWSSKAPRPEEEHIKYQFWPTAIAMGSLVGREFIQMLGVGCEYGPDETTIPHRPRGNHGHQARLEPQFGKSYLAFNMKREILMIKAKLMMGAEGLPPALKPLDAEFAFDDIAAQGIMIDEGSTAAGLTHVTVTINCRRPPRFYVDFEKRGGLKERNGFGRRERDTKRRATAMDFAVSTLKELDCGPIPAIPEGPCAYPTFFNTWRWTFDLNAANLRLLRQCAANFKSLAARDPELDLLSSSRRRIIVKKGDGDVFQNVYHVQNLSDIRFSTRTLIEGLIAHSIIRPGQIRDCLLALKACTKVGQSKVGSESKSPEDQERLQNRILESLYNEERIRNPAAVIRRKADYLKHLTPPEQKHLVMIRTVLVTPTRLVIGPPQQEPSNSVTRRYKDKLDAIIRVQFSDEEDRLFVQDSTKEMDKILKSAGVMARVRRALQHGIVLGGRTFMPVASSSSQQKDHAVWFIDVKRIDGLELRRWMGNVDETIVAKHAARMGLPFSTSRIVNIEIQLGKPLADVKRNGYCFTDGVGVAGREVMRMAAAALGTTKGINALPSAIQFRLGGAKGVLGCWPNLASDQEVRLRDSTIKFKSDLTDLNVVRLAKYQVAFLNRQFIMIMCANGVPEQLIIDIFIRAVDSLKGFRDRVKYNRTNKDDSRLIGLCSEFPLATLIKAGYHADPLVLDIAAIIECRALQDLKWKARVKLDGGVFLIGIADESGTLEENEVFCQYQESEEVEPQVVVSEVLICRAPALHPGDVRRTFAVDRPELRHLKNVIVFSVKGDRDLPNMLGGGDLDGDDYTLIWDQRFVQPLKNQEPMDYTAPEPHRVKHVTQADLNENFVQYILNDMLGQVDYWHLANSDIHSPFHEFSMKLSTIHSTAVDFAKTGIAATLDPRMRPKLWPDFMDKDGNKQIYPSEKVLGKIFRVVQPDPHFRPCDLKKLGYPTDPRITQYQVYESLLERLRPIKARYEADMHYDMRRYRVTEPEIPAGIAIANRRRKRARDQNLNEPLKDAYEAHNREAYEAAVAQFSGLTFTGALDPMQVLARHAYALTYEREHVEQWEAERNKGMWGGHDAGEAEEEEMNSVLRTRPMTSFAWVFWKELVSIVSVPPLL